MTGRTRQTGVHCIAAGGLESCDWNDCLFKTTNCFPQKYLHDGLESAIHYIKKTLSRKKNCLCCVLLIQFTPVAAGIARTDLFDKIE